MCSRVTPDLGVVLEVLMESHYVGDQTQGLTRKGKFLSAISLVPGTIRTDIKFKVETLEYF